MKFYLTQIFALFSFILFCTLSIAPAWKLYIHLSSRLPNNFLHPTGDARVTMGAGTPLFIRRTPL